MPRIRSKFATMLGIGQLLVIALIVFIIFGAGKLPSVMGELGKGIKNFRDNLQGDSLVKKRAKGEGVADSKTNGTKTLTGVSTVTAKRKSVTTNTKPPKGTKKSVKSASKA